MTITDPAIIKKMFDQRQFRDALGTFTTGVTIITTRNNDGTLVGITVNSFNSVSLDPPLVLWSLSKVSHSLSVFEATSHWAVHILSHDQDTLATHFSQRGYDKFAGLKIEAGMHDIPLLTGCTTRMQCKTTYRYDGGDHVIIVGEVMQFDHSDIAPLVYQRGNYAIATHKELTDEAEALIKTMTASDTISANSISYLLGHAYFQLYGKLREYGAQRGLNDVEFFVLNTLATRNGRSLAELNHLFVYAGHTPLINVLDDMNVRGLLQIVVDHGETHEQGLFYLTALGHDLVREISDTGLQIEHALLNSLGNRDIVALRTLLKRLIITVNNGALPSLEEQ